MKNIPPLYVVDKEIMFCSTVKYLEVRLMCGGDIKFDLMHVKRAFLFITYNSIFMHSSNLNEMAVLSLQES